MARNCRVGREDAPRPAEKGDKKSDKSPRSKPWSRNYFVCGKEGHNANTCPDRRDKATKRVQTRESSPKLLDENDVLATVDGYSFPMTIYTGVKISIMPRQFVTEESLTGRVESIKGFENTAPFKESPNDLGRHLGGET